MNKAIQIRNESVRGCGWRKVGGMYLMSDSPGRECGRLPIPCGTCPCCGRGMKQARGWTWVDGDEILRASPECPLRGEMECDTCAIHKYVEQGIGKVGLIWIGEGYYPTVGHFQREIDRVGISRRINNIPRGFNFENYVMLAHSKAILKQPLEMGQDIEHEPGIFMIFKPERIEIVVSGKESDAEIEGYLKRGLVPVKIERIEDEQIEMEQVK